MAFAAQAVGSIHAQIRTGKKIGNQLTRHCGLAEFIAALENMCPLGAVGAVGAGASEFTIIVAVVAVGAENLGPHRTAVGYTIQVQHVRKQARLWERTASGVHHGMAGSCGDGKLRDQV